MNVKLLSSEILSVTTGAGGILTVPNSSANSVFALTSDLSAKADLSAVELKLVEDDGTWHFPEFDSTIGTDSERRGLVTKTSNGWSLEIEVRDYDYETEQYGDWWTLDTGEEYAPLTATSFTWHSDHSGDGTDIVEYYGERTAGGSYYVLGNQLSAHLQPAGDYVSSINGKTGNVVLNASDVSAIPSSSAGSYVLTSTNSALSTKVDNLEAALSSKPSITLRIYED